MVSVPWWLSCRDEEASNQAGGTKLNWPLIKS